ncbi:hypothetical protein Y032_0004g2014 [Ancylostoma ceylanicum]|uniref:Uncharacterized protein n=1 Tax=Ancylostoma ceylanicum TaxID=53326 RepID=A0A016VV49_9BILA|nr:hypothetical protein Y032_0004g2014 [Ancylostoma ceylanicum]
MISCKLLLTIFFVLALSYTTSAQWGTVTLCAFSFIPKTFFQVGATEWAWECTDRGDHTACGAATVWAWECRGEWECTESKHCLRRTCVHTLLEDILIKRFYSEVFSHEEIEIQHNLQKNIH